MVDISVLLKILEWMWIYWWLVNFIDIFIFDFLVFSKEVSSVIKEFMDCVKDVVNYVIRIIEDLVKLW